MELLDQNKLKRAKTLIYILSAAIPLLVVVLFGIKIEGVNLSFLPPFYATINGLTALILVLALVAIKQKKNMKIHRSLIRLCLILSLVFLGSYVAYHMTSDSTVYGGDYRILYLIILISHIMLSVVIVPMVLFTYLFAWQGNYEKHKKWAKFTWPLWFYVAISGVVVYVMISPYYLN
ncbi:MAG: DUF420 domain-containing protein [Crocinitomicaceae bacterium]|nr:DUF420 domain-containing protein [Crocinitomicaceae bacterium]